MLGETHPDARISTHHTCKHPVSTLGHALGPWGQGVGVSLGDPILLQQTVLPWGLWDGADGVGPLHTHTLVLQEG